MKKILFIIYWLFLISLTVFSYLFIDPNLIYLHGLYSGFAFKYRHLATFLYVLIIFLFFIFYFLFLWFLNKKKIGVKDIKFLILITLILLFFSYPAMLSFDIFNYIATAKVLFLYQENPYIIYPIEFINDPYLEFTRAANKTALYGPFWIILTGIPYFAGFGNFILALFSFKAFIALFYISTIYLINKIDKNAVIFFALNPLVIIETLVNSHNDIVMVFFALLSFYFLFKKRYGLSAMAVIGSIFIKVATLSLAPVYAGMIKDRIIDKKINSEKAYYYSALFMFIIFLLSPLREELYPWYAIWFIAFTAFLYRNRFLQNLVLVFSFGLMLRYIPYMATGNYFGPTPMIRNLLMVTPVAIFLIYSWLRMLKSDNG